MNHPTIQIITKNHAYQPLLLLEDEGSYLEYTDKFGRVWKLEPLNNESISFPFRIIPIK